MKVLLRAGFAFLTLLLPGCATHHLWTESRFAEKHAATPQPHLEIYRRWSPPHFLAVYDEWNPRGSVTRRAYFLIRNDGNPLSKKPKFVGAHLAQMGTRIPIYDPNLNASLTTDATNGVRAIRVSPFSFELYDKESYLGSFELPVYRDGRNTAAQLLITPLALMADATIAAGVVCVIAAAAEAEYHPCVNYYDAGKGHRR